MENCLETLQNGLEVKSNLISYVEPYSPLKEIIIDMFRHTVGSMTPISHCYSYIEPERPFKYIYKGYMRLKVAAEHHNLL